MDAYWHDENLLCVYDPAWGRLDHVILPANNMSVAFIASSRPKTEKNARETDSAIIECLVFQNQVRAEWPYPEPHQWAFARNGRDFAYSQIRMRDGQGAGWDIMVNGEKKYECGYEVLYCLEWLSDTELIWKAWNHDERRSPMEKTDRKSHFFRNGVDVTGQIAFDTFLWGDMYSGFWVSDSVDNKTYKILDDGTMTEQEGAKRMLDFRREPDEIDALKPAYIQDKPYETLLYRGVVGPQFHEIESGHGLRPYVMSEDKKHLGYCGIRYATAAEVVGKYVEKLFDYVDSTSSAVLRHLIGWPLAILFNPYCGIGFIWMKKTRYWTPVHHPRLWNKSYQYAKACFFTPLNKLVVLAYTKKHACVLIDEREGPAFDQIHNVRYLKDIESVCYVGQRGQAFYRVTVFVGAYESI